MLLDTKPAERDACALLDDGVAIALLGLKATPEAWVLAVEDGRILLDDIIVRLTLIELPEKLGPKLVEDSMFDGAEAVIAKEELKEAVFDEGGLPVDVASEQMEEEMVDDELGMLSVEG